MTYHQIQQGSVQEAYGTIMGYIYHSPFSENPLIHGYAGMLSAYLAEKDNTRRSQSFVRSSQSMDPYGNADDEPSDSQAPIQRNVSEAIKHFEKACALDNSNDMFTRCMVELLFKSGQRDEAITLMEEFCKKNPTNPTIQHMLFSTLYAEFPNDHSKWIDHAKQCARLDPACDLESIIQPIVQHYEMVISKQVASESVPTRLEILRLLATRIDYGASEMWVWEKTVETLMHIKKKPSVSDADAEIWKDRLSWWSSFLFLRLPTPSTLNLSNEEDKLLVLKLICARYIYPVDYVKFPASQILFRSSSKKELKGLLKPHEFWLKRIEEEALNSDDA
ncbi:hypothetical protein K493DRAFT_336106 [Basidiobolus meristosporus CBS 931.73]|uniref:Uncharacterized protein n=1 Tax=Basidiobolus meristosporus CBS 931.73 TaxID=1314790 RepID=A0A1Y1YKM8_9FUNG|nr:hypothetical protein K493DRAFT_336106 [Basidiobolus meristosporus CBS 931.73]|eukprot:ORX98581.1 hypothetical protein K493DRAFT_336106 [Basidiobolus meristosporus CBS 931.73]